MVLYNKEFISEYMGNPFYKHAIFGFYAMEIMAVNPKNERDYDIFNTFLSYGCLQ